MIPPITGARVLMAPAADYAASVERKIAAAKQLTDALYQWMTNDLQNDLQALKSYPLPNPIEAMHSLQLQLERAQQKKEQIEAVIAQIKQKSGLEEMGEMLRLPFLLPLEEEIEALNRALSEAQAAAERDSAA